MTPRGIDAVLAALSDGDLTSAFDLLEAAIATTADARELYGLQLLRGRLLAAVGNVYDAFPAFAAALEHAGSAAEAGSALLARAEAGEAAGASDQARADALEALEQLTDPLDRAAAQQLLGRIERDQGDLATGIALLEAAVAAAAAHGGPERVAEASLDLAMALRLAGDTARSIALLEGIVADAEPPMAARILIQIGTTHGFAGDADAALDAYARALPLLDDPADRAVVRYNRAVVLRERGELEQARGELRQALFETGEQRVTFDALLLLGIVERERGELQAALDALRDADGAAIETGQHGLARLEIGTTMATTGLFGPAIEELTAAIRLLADDVDRARAHRYRGTARRELGLTGPALEDFEDAIALTADPDERARGEVTRALLLLSAGRRAEAREGFDRAVALASEPLVLRQSLAQRGAARSELGDLDGAIADLTQAAALAGEAGDDDLLMRALVDLGRILEAVGDTDAARSTFERASALAASGPLAHAALMALGELLVRLPDPLRALATLERAAAAAEDDRDARARAFLARATAALRWRRYGDAQRDFARLAMLQPARAILEQASVPRATTEQQLQHIAQLREELTRMLPALDTASYRAQPTLERGMLALSAGDAEAALTDLTRATRLFGLRTEQAVAWAHLALAHAWLGDCAEALSALGEAATLDPERGWLAAVRDDPHWRSCREQPGFPTDLL